MFHSGGSITLGAIIDVVPPKTKDIRPPSDNYIVTQLALSNPYPSASIERYDDSRHEINWNLMIFNVTGYVDTTAQEIAVNVTVMGIGLGSFSGSFADGIGIDVNLFHATGSLLFAVGEGNALYLLYDIDVSFDGHFKDEVEVISW